MSRHYDEVTGRALHYDEVTGEQFFFTEAEDAAMQELGVLCGKDRRLTKTEALRYVELYAVYKDVTERGFSSETLAEWARQDKELQKG